MHSSSQDKALLTALVHLIVSSSQEPSLNLDHMTDPSPGLSHWTSRPVLRYSADACITHTRRMVDDWMRKSM
jgi:hypothetical protein